MIGFHIIDSSGRHFCVLAERLGIAYRVFRAWEAMEMKTSEDEIEDIQSISPTGEVVQFQPETAKISGKRAHVVNSEKGGPCLTCGLEGDASPTECPGWKVPPLWSRAALEQGIDFVDGQWQQCVRHVETPKSESPAPSIGTETPGVVTHAHGAEVKALVDERMTLTAVLGPELGQAVAVLGDTTQDPELALRVREVALAKLGGEDGVRKVRAAVGLVPGVCPTGAQLRRIALEHLKSSTNGPQP